MEKLSHKKKENLTCVGVPPRDIACDNVKKLLPHTRRNSRKKYFRQEKISTFFGPFGGNEVASKETNPTGEQTICVRDTSVLKAWQHFFDLVMCCMREMNVQCCELSKKKAVSLGRSSFRSVFVQVRVYQY